MFRQMLDCGDQFIHAAGRCEPTGFTVAKDESYLAEIAGDNGLTHCHVLEKLCRRPEEFASIAKGYVRRQENVRCIQEGGNALMGHSAGEYDPAGFDPRLKTRRHPSAERALANQQKAQAAANIAVLSSHIEQAVRGFL